MAIGSVQDELLERLEAHPLKPEEEDLLVAAILGEQLRELLDGTKPESPVTKREWVKTGGSIRQAEPAGAYLRSITVSGFRGIGRQATLELTPGPGLTVVAGRNGSGKSSFAEALEVLLTGQIRRLEERTAVWKSTWRCLHGGPTEVTAELVLVGSKGAARVTRSWSPDNKNVTDGTVTVRVPGEPDSSLDRFGWGPALSLYRPFLSHAELEVLLDRPSQLYDQLNNLLGLEEINEISKRLSAARKEADAVAGSAKIKLFDLQTVAADCDDERARRLETMLKGKNVDPESVVAVGSGGTAGDSAPLELLGRLRSVSVPMPSTVTAAVDRLTAASTSLDEVGSSAAGDAATTASLLSTAVDIFHRHGPGPCPVCGRSEALNEQWLSETTDRIDRLRHQAAELREATAEAQRAFQEARLLIGVAPAELDQAASVGVDAAKASTAWATWSSLPPSDVTSSGLGALAAHLTTTHAPVHTAVSELQEVVRAELDRRQGNWAPVAEALSTWASAERAAQKAKALAERIKRVEAWLKSANNELRNDRLRPFAEGTIELWSQLRQESNVELLNVALTGTTTNRAVDFQVTVDGNSAAGLGVMSQGEVNALALSVFLPRATSPDSPLRFVVIDDPVQAMDPSKVEGMARVLSKVARQRQVVVFTHDDRLPAALRNLQLPARVVQVDRQSESVVSVRPSRDPVSDYLDDAIRLAVGDDIPVPVAGRVVPNLCRSALEQACFDITRRRRLSRGDSHASVEEAISRTTKLTTRLALAIFDDSERGGDVYAWLNQNVGGWAPNLVKDLNQGSHESIPDPRGMVNDTRKLVARLVEKLK